MSERRTNTKQRNINILRSLKDPAKREKRIPTGFKRLDEIMGGGFGQGVYVFGAMPSVGKTLLLSQIADYIALEEGREVIFYSMETTVKDLIARSLARHTKTLTQEQITTLRSGTNALKDFSEESIISELEKAIPDYEKVLENLYLYDDGITLEVIEKDMKQAKEEGVIPLVVIDYIQLLASKCNAKDQRTQNEMTIKKLDELSRTYNTAFLVASSLNRESYGKDKEVGMGALKESGMLEYGAVFVGIMTMKNNKVELEIVKNKKGTKNETVTFTPNFAHMTFKENAPTSNRQPRTTNRALEF